jgi:hypothetical protein
MNLDEYVVFVGQKIAQAQSKADVVEIIRLLRLLRETVDAKIKELEKRP